MTLLRFLLLPYLDEVRLPMQRGTFTTKIVGEFNLNPVSPVRLDNRPRVCAIDQQGIIHGNAIRRNRTHRKFPFVVSSDA